MKLTVAAFDQIGPERWRRACDHVDRKVEQLKEKDNYREQRQEPVIINLDDDTTDSDDSCTDTAGSSTDTASEME